MRVAFVHTDKKLLKTVTEETKVSLPGDLEKRCKFARHCFVPLPFLEQPVVPEMPVQKTC